MKQYITQVTCDTIQECCNDLCYYSREYGDIQSHSITQVNEKFILTIIFKSKVED